MWSIRLEMIAKSSKMTDANRDLLSQEAERIFNLGRGSKAREIRECLLIEDNHE